MVGSILCGVVVVMVTTFETRRAPGVVAEDGAMGIEVCWSRPTMERTPAPPGVVMARLKRGSTATSGESPVFNVTEPTTQGGVAGLGAIGTHASALVVPASASKEPLLVLE